MRVYWCGKNNASARLRVYGCVENHDSKEVDGSLCVKKHGFHEPELWGIRSGLSEKFSGFGLHSVFN